MQMSRLLLLIPLLLWSCSPVAGLNTDNGTPKSPTAGTSCKATTDCGGNQTCLPNGTCGATCSSQSQCTAGDRCSAGGGCVASNDCGADTDCTGGLVCGTGAVCVAKCTPSSCASGETCNSLGHCRANQPVGTPTNNPNAPASCGGELFEATPVQANFLIVLDHSGSMRERVGGQSKWSTAKAAVQKITADHEAKIRFGLQMFSLAVSECNAGQTDVQIGDQMAAEIAAALPADADGKRTPIGGALTVALANTGLYDTTRSNNVLLVTDGKENCNGNPVAVTADLFSKGIKTYVVGFGGEIDANMLSKMATEGGTARGGPIKYYQADDPAGLDTALRGITQGGMGCDLKLAKAPADPSKLYVYVNGSQQPRDPTMQNGWEYTASNNRITLYGTSCGLISNDGTAKVSIVYGCPDGTLVDGAPGSDCGANEHCASGKCTAGLCETPSGAKPVGTVCGADPECASGRCTNGRCESVSGGKPGGTACAGNTECASGSCTNGLCEASSTQNPNGAACTRNSECVSGACTAGTCTSPNKPGGSTCVTGSECASTRCTAGRCELASGGAAGGATCTSNSQCTSGTCTNGICESSSTASPGGVPCTGNGECFSQQCTAGACTSGLPGATACTANSQCASLQCKNGLCESGAAAGTPCSANSECASGACSGGFCAPIFG